MKLTGRLVTLVFRNTSCNWILDFLSNRLLFRLLIFMKLEDNTTIITLLEEISCSGKSLGLTNPSSMIRK